MTANYTQADYERAINAALADARGYTLATQAVILRRIRKVVAFVGADYLNGRDFDPSPEQRE